MNVIIQEIEAKYDHDMSKIIKTVGEEFGAIGEGFGPSDDEVQHMSQYYQAKTNSIYLIVLINKKVVGGCGLAAFSANSEICELKKLFLLPETRGLGLGKQLATQCLEFAKKNTYKQCYLDTLKTMTLAIHLYEQLGFKHIQQPLEGTIHNACDVWMLKDL